MRQLCPFCKMTIDERIKDPKKEIIYPDWAYYYPLHEAKDIANAETFISHLVNYHRLPESVAALMGVAFAASEFMIANPNFTLAAPEEGGKLRGLSLKDLKKLKL